MSAIRSNYRKMKDFENTGGTWWRKGRIRVQEFAEAKNFLTAREMIEGMHSTTKRHFLSCLTLNGDYLGPFGKRVENTTSCDLSLPGTGQVSFGVLSSNTPVSVSLFRDDDFVASTLLRTGEEFTAMKGSVLVRTGESPAYLLITSSPQ